MALNSISFLRNGIKFSNEFSKTQRKEFYNSETFQTVKKLAKEKKIKILISPIHQKGKKDGIRLQFFQSAIVKGLRRKNHLVGTMNAVDRSDAEVLESTAKILDLMS